jgi:hypothetical protein
MVSIWWLVAAFVVGGYAGALVFALLCMARAVDDGEPASDRAGWRGQSKMPAP